MSIFSHMVWKPYPSNYDTKVLNLASLDDALPTVFQILVNTLGQ